MSYVEFMFRLEAGALRQLVIIGSIALGQGGDTSGIALTQLREVANVD